MFKFFLILLVCLAVFLLNVGEIHHIAILHVLVWAVYTCQCLEQVMLLDHTVQIQFLQTWSIKACLEHLEYNKQVNFAILEQFYPLGTSFLVETVVCDKCSTIATFLTRLFLDFHFASTDTFVHD